jgi:hypothetical protein
MATPNEPTPDEAPKYAYPRVVIVAEEDGIVAIEKINALLRSGGSTPRSYRARGATTWSRREILGDKEIDG